MGAPKDNFVEAIKSLRAQLGYTQMRMAMELGISLRGYINWERGETAPKGQSLVKLIAMCPNSACRARFGLDIYPGMSDSTRFSERAAKGPEEALRFRAREALHRAVEIIFEQALQGSHAATQILVHEADELIRKAGNLTAAPPRQPAIPRRRAITEPPLKSQIPDPAGAREMVPVRRRGKGRQA
jgi:transcriptional regulator with XRE-family HTH domain